MGCFFKRGTCTLGQGGALYECSFHTPVYAQGVWSSYPFREASKCDLPTKISEPLHANPYIDYGEVALAKNTFYNKMFTLQLYLECVLAVAVNINHYLQFCFFNDHSAWILDETFVIWISETK
jgi:hypothetical protein